MALIITPTEDKKIYVQGTSIELSQVYNRLEFGCRPNGTTMEIAFNTYLDASSYRSGSYLPTDLPTSNLITNIDPTTQIQGLEAAHDLAKLYYEELGYDVAIII
jgi:hypothetical protein